jgi:single-strand DNA-binding protein
MSTNHLTLNPGYVAHKPSLKFNQNLQCDEVTFSFAPLSNAKKKDNEETEWWNVVAYGKLAQIMAEHLDKGSFIFIKGEDKSSAYNPKQGERAGSAVLVRKIKADYLLMLPSAKTANKQSNTEVPNITLEEMNHYYQKEQAIHDNVEHISSDDIPF